MPSKKAKGPRKKSRDLLKKKGPDVTVNKMLQEIPIGSKVDIRIDSSVHSAMPPTRYQGFTGTVTGKRGVAFMVAVSKGNKPVELIVHPAHLTISRGTGQQQKKENERAKVAA
ncbi:MAG: 50S ribosomal protein L21e [archaeon]|mgnify:CR=1 FL=1